MIGTRRSRRSNARSRVDGQQVNLRRLLLVAAETLAAKPAQQRQSADGNVVDARSVLTKPRRCFQQGMATKRGLHPPPDSLIAVYSVSILRLGRALHCEIISARLI
jgi:hypothetical protein